MIALRVFKTTSAHFEKKAAINSVVKPFSSNTTRAIRYVFRNRASIAYHLQHFYKRHNHRYFPGNTPKVKTTKTDQNNLTI